MQPTFVYVACSDEGSVDVFSLDAAGKLTFVGRESGLDTVRTLAVDTLRGLLYTGHNTAVPRAGSFRIEPRTGRLSAMSAVDLPATTTYVALAGSRLLSASYFQGVVASAPLAYDGGLAGPATVACAPGPFTHSAEPCPDGAFVYAASLGDDKVLWFTDGPGGSLVEAGSVRTAPASGPRHLRFSASGHRVYLLAEMSGTVTVYARDEATGSLRELQSIPSVPDSLGLAAGAARTPSTPPVEEPCIWCADLRLAGDFLFTTERESSTITTFAVDPGSGLLTYLRTTATEAQPRGTAVDPGGSFLLVCGELSDAISVYRIDPDDGTLELTDQALTGAGPLWIACRRPIQVALVGRKSSKSGRFGPTTATQWD